MKHFLAVAFCIFFATLGSATAVADPWKMPTNLLSGSFQLDVLQIFADDVRRRTGGAIDIEPSGESTMTDAEIIDAVWSGDMQVGSVFLSNMSNLSPLYELDTIPYLATTFDEAWKLWGASQLQTEQLMNEQGFTLLFVTPWPPQGIYSQHRLTSVADLAGLRLRIYSAPEAKLAELLGAKPVTVPMAEVNDAFNEDRVDAMISSSATGVAKKAWEFATYYYDLRAFVPKQVVIMNKAVFDGLDQSIQSAIQAAASTAGVRGWQASLSTGSRQTEFMRAAGLAVSDPPPRLMDGLSKISVLMAADWGSRVGAVGTEIIETYRH
jgi:TRAP-type C4-dicarboxylate transport system substrate-binding protein